MGIPETMGAGGQEKGEKKAKVKGPKSEEVWGSPARASEGKDRRNRGGAQEGPAQGGASAIWIER